MKGTRALFSPSITLVTALGKGVWSSLSAFNSKPKATWEAGEKKATCWGGVKKQDNLTAPPFPLKAPQAGSDLQGEGNINIMFSPYLGGLIIYYYSPSLPNGFAYKGKRQHKADFMLTCNGNNTTSNHDRALVCPLWHGGAGGLRLKGLLQSPPRLCRPFPNCPFPWLSLNGSGTISPAGLLALLGKGFLPASSSWSHPAVGSHYFHPFLPVAEETRKGQLVPFQWCP